MFKTLFGKFTLWRFINKCKKTKGITVIHF